MGFEGQQKIAAARLVIVGSDLTCEIAARSLAAAGVGRLRLVRDGHTAPLDDLVAAALAASNPDSRLEWVDWPRRAQTGDRNDEGDAVGGAWCEALADADVVIRSGFDDDPMLRAAVKLGVPAIIVRARAEGVQMVSFRKHGPCPHAPLDVPGRAASPASDEGAAAVLAGHLAAAEALVLVSGAGAARSARARFIRVPFDEGEPRSVDIPWTPECFACGGSGTEMSFP